MNYRIGLDLGIASVGWAILEDDYTGKPKRIVKLGARIFDSAENPKDGSSLALNRREARETRRRLRRRNHRIKRTKNLLEKYNIMTTKEIENMYATYKFQFNPYELRVKGLDEKLTNSELSRILISFVKRRGYKSNSKSEETNDKEMGKLLTATKENELLMKEKGYRTVGEMYLKDEKFKMQMPDGRILLKVRNTTDDYKNTPLRKLLLDEIKQILNKQKELNVNITSDFIDEYINIFTSQRNFDDGPGQPSIYAGNQIEKMLGKCTFEKEENRAAKATYTFEYFKLLQDINHIKIEKHIINETGKKEVLKRPLTEDERNIIINLAKAKVTLTYASLRTALNLESNERFNMIHYKATNVFSDEINKEAEKERKFKEFESYHKMRVAMDKTEKNYILKLSTDELDVIGTVLTLYKNDNKRIEKLAQLNLPENIINEMLKLSFSKVGNLSIKAMKKIILYLEKGYTYDKAVNEVYEDFRGVVNTEKKKKIALRDLEQELSNPVVKRSVSQAIKVLNAITRTYGEPDVINVELARELSKNFADRQNIKKNQENNMQSNEKAKEDILKLGKSNPTGQDIVKYKLWKEQDGICVYSGKRISIEDLFTEAVDVDHIIPYSMCFDDTYKNKVLVLSSENRQKGNRIPYQYMQEKGRDLDEYEIRVNNIIKNYSKKQRLLKQKFTREDANEWKDRNICDTQYISRLMYNLIKNHVQFSNNENFERKVFTVNGQITSHIRKRLGINKIRENGDEHHAIDAAIIATVSQGMIQKITKYYQYIDGRYEKNSGEYIDIETGEIITKEQYEAENGSNFPEPWPKFRKELDIRTTCKTKARMEECLLTEKIFYDDYDDVKPIFISRMPRRKITGQAHLDTIRGLRKSDEGLKTLTKTELTKLKLDKNGEIERYPESQKQDDKLLYNALVEQLRKFGGNGTEAFKKPFYKPKSDGTPGPLVKKVKLEDKTTLAVELNNGKAIAANGDMIRIDVFKVEGEGYYFVPIYVSDTIKNKLPNKASVASKTYAEWKEMQDKDFIFSLYPRDLFYVKSKNKIKLTSINKQDKESLDTNELFAYYVNADISTAAIACINHNGEYERRGLGIKRLQEFKKYEVDVLGNYHEVKLPEKRQDFSNLKKGGSLK